MALKMACNYILVSKQLQKRLNMKKETQKIAVVVGSCLASLTHVHMKNIKHHIYIHR